jgi:hypothetical protein
MISHPLQNLPFSVGRIKTGNSKDPSLAHVGTGFFFSFSVDGISVPTIVSNRHVLGDAPWVELEFALATPDKQRILGKPYTVRINRGELPVLCHPDPNVDLALMPIAPILNMLSESGIKFHVTQLSENDFPAPHVESALHAASGILMIGFPNGLMDEHNNLPLVRRGILATPYAADYMGRPDFVVDIASFGGSSGSPVFAVFDQTVPNENGGLNFLAQPAINLIGILHSGPTLTAEGRIVAAPVPTSFLAQTKLMMHIGFCAKVHLLNDFKSQIRAHL